MKFRALLLIAFLFSSGAFAKGGQGVGNGGGGWACFEKDAPSLEVLGATQAYPELRWITTLDVFEAENEWGFTVPRSSVSHVTQVDGILSALEPVAKDLARELQDRVRTIRSVQQLTWEALPHTKDALPVIRPDLEKSCPGGRIEYVQIAVYYENGVLEFDRHYFDHPKFSETDRAALILHEAIYAYLRESKVHDPNSVRSRHMTGILVSSQDSSKKASDFATVLRMPQLMNRDVNDPRSGGYVPEFSEEDQTWIARLQEVLERAYRSVGAPRAASWRDFADAFAEHYAAMKRNDGRSPKDVTKAIRSSVGALGVVSVQELRDWVARLPGITQAPDPAAQAKCVRMHMFGMDLPDRQVWMGYFAHFERLPQSRFTHVSTDEILRTIVVDPSMTVRQRFSGYALKDGSWERYLHAPGLDTYSSFRALSETEFLGWTLLKDPKSNSYWDFDYAPVVQYCKITR